jgi:tetratricopeptide (TPR) repeat protein
MVNPPTVLRVKTLVARVAVLTFAGAMLCGLRAAEESAPTNAAPETNAALVQSVLVLQEQLRETQRTLEQARSQSQAEARRSEETLAARLNLLEQVLQARRADEIASVQQTLRTVVVVGSIAVIAGLAAVIFAGVAQARAVRHMANVSQELRLILPALAAPSAPMLGRGAVDEANERLLRAIGGLEKRLTELETGGPGAPANGHAPKLPPASVESPVTVLLGKGQALLNLEQHAEALEQFEQVLQIDPASVEAWIKKGTALERLQRIDDAIAAYDRAIAADDSAATAYLFKAGAFNRQKRYADALQCYEKALTLQQKSRRGIAN